MDVEKEKRIYQCGAILLFFLFIVVSWKYVKISEFAKKQSADKVYYCREYHKAMCSIESLLVADTTRSNIGMDNPNVLQDEN